MRSKGDNERDRREAIRRQKGDRKETRRGR